MGTRCSDYTDPLIGLNLPRGKGSVSILWPKQWSSMVKRLNEGNERVIAIEIKGQGNMYCKRIHANQQQLDQFTLRIFRVHKYTTWNSCEI